MKNKLTPEQLNYLNTIKNEGQYQSTHRGCKCYRREILWRVLYEYLRLSGTDHFRAKYFRADTPIWTGHVVHALMYDCPLKGGEVINVIRYGKQKGFLRQVGVNRSIRWYLTDLVLKEGMQNESRDNELRDLR